MPYRPTYKTASCWSIECLVTRTVQYFNLLGIGTQSLFKDHCSRLSAVAYFLQVKSL